MHFEYLGENSLVEPAETSRVREELEKNEKQFYSQRIRKFEKTTDPYFEISKSYAVNDKINRKRGLALVEMI